MSEGNDDGLVEKGRSEISSATRSTSIVCNGDLEQQDYIEATWFHKFVFLALGFADLFYWNCVLNILFDIRDKYYPAYPSMTDTLNAVNNITSLIVAIYTIKTGAMNMTVILASGALLSVACLLTAIAVQWCPGVSGVVWLHIANAVAGACSGFYQTGACGLASVVGQGGLTGYVSAGQGVTGVATFALWQIISHSKLDVKPALWTLMAIGCGITLTSAYFFWLLLRKPEIARRVAQVRKSLKEEANDPDAPSYLFIFKSSWLPMCTTFWCMFISLFFFPNIGPINWNEGDFTNYTLGTFQVGDLIGRYLPNILSFTLMPIWMAAVVSGARTILLPLAVLCWKFPLNSFWGSRTLHMILMALLSLTNGWILTSVYMRTPSTLPQENWRSRAMSLVVLCVLFGIAAGLWSARIFTAVNIPS